MLKKSSPSAKKANAAPNLDDVRRQSRHRLIGASLLVVVAVVGFPLVFDTQPRRIPVDLPIHIPAQPAVFSPATPVTAAIKVSEAPAAPRSAPVQNPALVAKPAPVPAASPAPAAGERFVVQVGAYADVASVRNVRQRIERTGLKTYTQVAKTPQGDRTRVRLGPFKSRAEAERAAQQIKSLGLTSSILTL